VGWRGTAVLLILVIGAALYLYEDVNADRRERSWRAIFEEPREAPPGELVTHLLAFDPKTVTASRSGRRGAVVPRAGDGGRARRATDMDDPATSSTCRDHADRDRSDTLRSTVSIRRRARSS
jgi:hypothetical protein